MSDEKFTKAMVGALEVFAACSEPKSAYGARQSLKTIEALCARGHLRLTNPGRPGNMAFPRTSREFAITDKGRAAVARLKGE